MLLGAIDEVEVKRELRDPEHGGKGHRARPDSHPLAPHRGKQEHRDRRDREAIGHRPARRNDAELPLDDDPDRKSVVEGKSVSVRVDLGGGRSIKKKKKYINKRIKS